MDHDIPTDIASFSVLLIDINRSSRAFFNTVLSKAGTFSITTVASPQEALDALAEDVKLTFQAIILDITFLGEGNDTILLQRICTHPSAQSADLVVLAEEVSDEEQVLFKELGVIKTLPKQIGGGHLLSEMNEVRTRYLEDVGRRRIVADLSKAIIQHDTLRAEALLKTPEVQEVIDGDSCYIHLKAESLLLQKRVSEAIILLRATLKDQKNLGETPTLRCLATYGKALCMQGKFAQALKVFDKLSSRSPLNLMHSLLAGEALLQSGKHKEAARTFEGILKHDCAHREAHVGLAKSSLALGDTARAFAELSQLQGPVESHSLASYFNNAGVAMIRAGKTGEALLFFERAASLFQSFRFIIDFNLGMTHLRLMHHVKAVQLFEAVIRADTAGILAEKKVLQIYQNLGPEGFLAAAEKGTLGKKICDKSN